MLDFTYFKLSIFDVTQVDLSIFDVAQVKLSIFDTVQIVDVYHYNPYMRQIKNPNQTGISIQV